MFDWILETILFPAIAILIWIGGLIIGVLFLIGPFLEGEHWWSLFFMWPLGVLCIIICLLFPLALLNSDPKTFRQSEIPDF